MVIMLAYALVLTEGADMRYNFYPFSPHLPYEWLHVSSTLTLIGLHHTHF